MWFSILPLQAELSQWIILTAIHWPRLEYQSLLQILTSNRSSLAKWGLMRDLSSPTSKLLQLTSKEYSKACRNRTRKKMKNMSQRYQRTILLLTLFGLKINYSHLLIKWLYLTNHWWVRPWLLVLFLLPWDKWPLWNQWWNNRPKYIFINKGWPDTNSTQEYHLWVWQAQRFNRQAEWL